MFWIQMRIGASPDPCCVFFMKVDVEYVLTEPNQSLPD